MIIHSPIFSGSINQAESAYANLSGSFTGSFKGVGDFEGLVADSVEYANILNKPALVSGSSQVSYPQLSNIPSGIISSSAQIDTLFNIDGLISGSSQVQFNDINNNPFSSSASNITITAGKKIRSSDENTIIIAENIDVEGNITLLGAVDGVDIAAFKGDFDTFKVQTFVTGSSQVNADSITNFDANVKDKLNADLVVSGSASDVKTFLSLQNVTNESKATMFTSPDLTGTPTAPTAVANTNSTQIATTAYVQQELTDLIGGANAAFDTLIEISASLASGDSTLNTLVDGKLSKSANLSDLTNTTTARTNLGVAIGTDVQAYNATLAAVAGGTYSGDDSITTIGTVTAGSVTAILPTGVVSGSSQVAIASTSGFGTYINQAVLTSSDVQFAKLGVGGASDATYELRVTGDIGATGDIVAYVSSDERLKNNVELISNPIEKVQALRGVTWEWNELASDAAKQSPNVGVIAQEVQKVLPQLVHDRENGFKGVDYAKLTGLLIEAIKEQQKQIDELKSKLK